MFTLKHVLGACKWISKALHGPQEELPQVVGQISDQKDKMQKWRNGESSGTDEKIFENSKTVIGEIRVDKLPRSCRQPRTGATNRTTTAGRLCIYQVLIS